MEISKRSGSEVPTKMPFLNRFVITSLILLKIPNLSKDPDMEIQLLEASKYILSDACRDILSSKGLSTAQNKLHWLCDFTLKFGSKKLSEEIIFSSNRLYGLASCCMNDPTAAIRYLNTAVHSYPSGTRPISQGLLDALILLSEAYASIGR
jgi:hypothetical protein